MATSEVVTRNVPYLRRYARALMGSQRSGDAYVGAVLEALAEDPKQRENGNSRTALYRTFTRIWNSLDVNGQAEPAGQELPFEKRLVRLTPLPRQAFLLMALEGFSEAEAAEVLEVDVATVRDLAREAGKELAADIATSVLIIEDEPMIAADIEALVENLGHKVIGIAATHDDAVRMAKSKRPGLILADIQLADGSSGLEAVNDMLNSFEAPVVFVTAYPERFLSGERPEPAFLIPKPFQPAVLSAVISQALFFERNAKRPLRHAS